MLKYVARQCRHAERFKQVDVAAPPKNLYVADDLAWVSASQDLAIVDVSNPNDLSMVRLDPVLNNANLIVLNGSGLGISTGLGSLAVVGTDSPATGLPIDASPVSIALGDLNRDGNLDLVSASTTGAKQPRSMFGQSEK